MKNLRSLSMSDLSLEEMAEFMEKQEHPSFKNRLNIVNHRLQLLLRANTEGSLDLLQMYNSFNGFREFCEQHLNKEQRMLFPFVEQTCQVFNSGKTNALPQESLLHCSLRIFRAEHATLLAYMGKIRVIGFNFDPSSTNSPPLKRLLQLFKDLDQDLHDLIYFEEQQLFPTLLNKGQQIKIRTEKAKLAQMMA